MVSGIFNDNLSVNLEVADTGNVEQEVKDQQVYDNPQLQQDELKFIEDLMDAEIEDDDEELD